MTEEWKEIRICDIGKVITGNTPPRKQPEFYGNHTLFIKPTDVSVDTKYTYYPEECYSELGYNKYIKSLIPKGATCVVTIGSIGKKITKAHCDCFINQAMNAVIPTVEYDEEFVYYLLKHNLNQLKTLDSGTASGRENVSKSSFSNIKLKVPKSLITQKKIGSILSTYDDLIENNLRRIKLLEEIAQRTYEEWFVKFTVNGEKLKIDDKAGLPEGWERNFFKEVLDFKTGKLDSNAMDANGSYNFYTCSKEIYKTNTFCFNGEAVLLGGNNATGDFSLFYANEKFDAYQRTYIVTTKDGTCPLVYVYHVLMSYLSYFKNVSSGAATKFLTIKTINATTIILPTKNIIQKYNKTIRPCFDQIINLKKQNIYLIETRDLSLAKLMKK